VIEVAEAVSVMTVPAAVPLVTLTTTGKVTMLPGAMLETVQGLVQGIEQVIAPALPTAGVEQLQPAGSGASDTKVVLVGTCSVN
jgi:hypothetical protein